MCDFRGSSRRNRSFLAEDLGHWLRFFSLEAENDAVLWLGNQLLTAATNHSDCLYEALVHRLAHNGAVVRQTPDQLAVFQGASEAPISDSYGSSEQRGKTANWPRPGGLR